MATYENVEEIFNDPSNSDVDYDEKINYCEELLLFFITQLSPKLKNAMNFFMTQSIMASD